MEATKKEKVILLQCVLLDPRLESLPGGRRDLELHGLLGLLLHHDGVHSHLITMAHITHFQGQQVTAK